MNIKRDLPQIIRAERPIINIDENTKKCKLFLVAKIVLYLGSAYLGCAREINHLAALLLQEIEFALPVVAYHERVDVIFMHIGALLTPAFLRDDKIHIADCLH